MVKINNFFSDSFFFSIFLFILILSSSVKAFGYPIVNAILIGVFLLLMAIINRKVLNIKFDFVLFFFIYLILQVFRGIIILDDLRVIYFIFFFSVVYLSYQYINYNYLNSNIDSQFIEKTYNFCFIYFVIYGLLGALVDDPNNFQQEYWVGSSSAFLLLIPLLSSHFLIISKNNFFLSKFKLPSLMVCMVAATIHYSRMGVYLIFLYIILLLIWSLFLNYKKILTIICVLFITLLTWDLSRKFFYINQEITGLSQYNNIIKVSNIFLNSEKLPTPNNESKNNQENNENWTLKDLPDLDRVVMMISTYDKLISSPTEFLIGSGWYTSREKLKPFELANRMEYDLNVNIVQSDKPLQINTFVVIFSDLGLVGSLFFLYFFFKSAYQIIETKIPGRFIILCLLLSNGLFYLVGYSVTSVIAFLLFLPGGFIITLLRVYSPLIHSNPSGNRL